MILLALFDQLNQMTYKIYTFQAYIQPRLSYSWTFH